MDKLKIYTDTMCHLQHQGNGGSYYFVVYDGDDIIIENGGFVIGSTSNRLELIAIIEAINNIPSYSDVVVCSKSKYAIGFIKNNGTNSDNADLRRQITENISSNSIDAEFQWTGDTQESDKIQYVRDKARNIFNNNNCVKIEYDYKRMLQDLVYSIAEFSALKRGGACQSEMEKAKRCYDLAYERAEQSLLKDFKNK